MIIGLTGTIGSGKTTVAKIFRKFGFKVIDADRLGHEILNKEASISLKKIFGTEIFFRDNIDRKKLGKLVFNDKNKLKNLNKIIWPLIIKRIKEEIKKNRNKDMVIDAALIIEAGLRPHVDKLVVLKVNKKMQIKRLLNKGMYSKEQIEKIIMAQMPQREKIKYADYVIDNNGSLKNSEQQVLKIIDLLSKKCLP